MSSLLSGQPTKAAARSCRAPASYRYGRDGACTRLLAALRPWGRVEAELPGILPHSLSRYWHSGGSSTISRSYRCCFFLGFPVGRSVFFLWGSSLHTATPKNLKVFGLGGGVEARGPQKMNRKILGSQILLARPAIGMRP